MRDDGITVLSALDGNTLVCSEDTLILYERKALMELDVRHRRYSRENTSKRHRHSIDFLHKSITSVALFGQGSGIQGSGIQGSGVRG